MSKYMSLEQTIRKLGVKGTSQPLEKDMNDQVHAGSYSSKHFEVSAPAQKLYASLPKDVDPDKAERSVQLHDKLFAIHKKTSASERSTTSDQEEAQRLHDEIMSLAKEMGLEDKHGHVKDSLEHIKKYVDTQTNVKDDIKPEDVAKRYGTPPKDYQNDVKADADIDNLARFRITRDKKGQRKLKIIDDEFKLGAEKMDRIEKVSASFLEALKQVKSNAEALEEKKKMTKADIAALRDPKGSIDADDLAALRAGEHKKKVKEEVEQIDEMEHEDDDGWYAHKEMHGSKAVSKEDWKKGYRLNSKGEKVKKSNEEVEELEEGGGGVRGLKRASRTWADKKTSTDIAKKLSKKSYRPPGEPSKAEMREKGSAAVNAFLAKGGKIRKEEAEIEEIDEAQFITIQKGMEKKRVRNNPVDVMKARKEGWAIQEEVEIVDEGIDKAQVERKLRSKYTGGNPKVTFHRGVVKVNAAGKDYHHKITKGQVEDRPFMTVDEEYISEAKSKKPSPSTDNPDMKKIREIAGPGKIMHKEPWHPSHAGHNLYTHTDHNSNTPKIRAFKVHQKTGKVTEFKNYKPSFGEEVETVEEGNEMKNLAKSQKAATIKREVQQKKQMFAKKDAADKAEHAKAMQKEEFMERAIAVLGEDFKDATYDELVEQIVKRARGRPRKNPLPDPNAPKRPRGRPKKGSGPVSTSTPSKPGESKPADTDKDREHIVMALRKSISLRGEHGVKFADGSTHKISAEHAQKALKMHDSLNRPSEKMVFQRKLAASHSSFKKALEDKNPGSEETKKTGITLAKKAEF